CVEQQLEAFDPFICREECSIITSKANISELKRNKGSLSDRDDQLTSASFVPEEQRLMHGGT
ncbi:MAG: hypothetical protein II474_08880, partial [Firmicutes bacterium]|nr:hypothetical protein [Bacillota bacterium]